MADTDVRLDPNRVQEIILDCLYKPEEIEGLEEGATPEGAIIVEAITNTFGFHPERLERHRDEVFALLKELPTEFMETGGGGWSFLNACNDKHGSLWTGSHQSMESLFALGIAIEKAAWLMPRDMWAVFPGGMPYVVVKDA